MNCHLPTLLLLLATINADFIAEPDLQNLPEVANYRRIIAQRNVELIDRHNRDASATFTLHAYPQFVGLN